MCTSSRSCRCRVGHVLDDVQKALNSVRQLRSRGVTRCYDLHKLNKHDIVDAEEDEHRDDPNGELEEESATVDGSRASSE